MLLIPDWRFVAMLMIPDRCFFFVMLLISAWFVCDVGGIGLVFFVFELRYTGLAFFFAVFEFYDFELLLFAMFVILGCVFVL